MRRKGTAVVESKGRREGKGKWTVCATPRLVSSEAERTVRSRGTIAAHQTCGWLSTLVGTLEYSTQRARMAFFSCTLVGSPHTMSDAAGKRSDERAVDACTARARKFVISVGSRTMAGRKTEWAGDWQRVPRDGLPSPRE